MRSNRFIPKPTLNDKETVILNHAQGKSCLHVGMGGFIDDPAVSEQFVAAGLADSLHGRLSRTARSLVGIDVNPYMLDRMAEVVPGEYFLCNVTSETDIAKLAGRRFELIVFGDVIEHLDNPGTALRNLLSLLSDDGRIIISTVNTYSLDAIVKMLIRYEAVHEEHTAYFSYSTLRRLLSMTGLEILDFMYYTHKEIANFDSLSHRIGWFLEKPLIRLFPQYAMGILAIARAAPGRERATPSNAVESEGLSLAEGEPALAVSGR
jgi:2-polyprenyl-3-methyl-5-hydroxy-6-metoxy-1,4-benzoquinol methylase